MKQETEECAYCDRYGYTERNKAFAYFLEMKDLDFGADDLAGELDVSEKEADGIIERSEKEGILKKTRVFKNIQLYSLEDNDKTRKLIKGFNEALADVVKEHDEKEGQDKDKSLVRIPA